MGSYVFLLFVFYFFSKSKNLQCNTSCNGLKTLKLKLN